MKDLGGLGGLVRAAAFSLIVAACAGQIPATASPVVVPPTTAPATLVPTLQPTTLPTPDWTPPDGPMPSGVIYEVAKPDMVPLGGHGGATPLDLPAKVAVDYTVTGTCDFTIGIFSLAPGATSPIATFDLRALGPTVSGTWHVTVAPGSYAVSPADSGACAYLMFVRAE